MKIQPITGLWLALWLSVGPATAHPTDGRPTDPTWLQPPTAGQPPYALVVFFLNTCPHCHRFAPKFHHVAKTLGLPTYAFSLDGPAFRGPRHPGIGLLDYPDAIPATPTLTERFFPDPGSLVVPTTFLIDLRRQRSVRVSVGDVPEPTLQRRVQTRLNDTQWEAQP